MNSGMPVSKRRSRAWGRAAFVVHPKSAGIVESLRDRAPEVRDRGNVGLRRKHDDPQELDDVALVPYARDIQADRTGRSRFP